MRTATRNSDAGGTIACSTCRCWNVRRSSSETASKRACSKRSRPKTRIVRSVRSVSTRRCDMRFPRARLRPPERVDPAGGEAHAHRDGAERDGDRER